MKKNISQNTSSQQNYDQKKDPLKTISIILTAILVFSIGYMLLQTSKPAEPVSNSLGSTSTSTIPPQSVAASTPNVYIKDNIQYINLTAKGGYSPNTTMAKGWMPTKLIVKTDGTYDCSSSLVIRSAGYREILPATGETTVDLKTPKSGETMQGLCGMGMYSFNVKFN